MSYQVYSEKHLCREITVKNCSFLNCRQGVTFEKATNWLPNYSVTEYNFWIKDCSFTINDAIQDDFAHAPYSPVAVWIQAQGNYNVMVDNCVINGNGEICRSDPLDPTQDDYNVKNGIVVDMDGDEALYQLHLAVTRPLSVPYPTVHGYIEDVYENGILLRTQGGAKLVTQLDSSRFPRRSNEGLTNLSIYGSVIGSGINIYSTSTCSQSEIGVYDCEITKNAACGIEALVDHGGVLGFLDIQDNTIAGHPAAGVKVCSRGGECEISLEANVICGESAANPTGDDGIFLNTRYDNATPSRLEAILQSNQIFYTNGDGLHVEGDNSYTGGYLTVDSANDRIHHNHDTGVNIVDAGTGSSLAVQLKYLTCCHNNNGLLFDDSDPTVNVVNSIFYHNTIEDVGPGYTFTGNITYCDWESGFYGGGTTYGYGCIGDNPNFADFLYYHLTYDPIEQGCVDKGDDGAATIRKDMEGDNRRIDVDPNPTLTDMGADEHLPE